MNPIECVITCVNYSDFLAEALPHNRTLFDKTVVVTAPEDKETRKLCEYWNVLCVPTDAFESRWGRFNKGKAINVGLDQLDRKGWIIHMDADIVLPPDTRRFIENAQLDEKCLYGIDRHIIRSYEEWRSFFGRPKLQREGWTCPYDSGSFIHIHHFSLGERVAHPSGYVPLGYFQMWHPASSGIVDYPAEHTDAGRGDMLHALRWPRSQRHLIPEIVAYHLESEPAAMGANWSGRKTKIFGPDQE